MRWAAIGFRGATRTAARLLRQHAVELAEAGAECLVLEMVPSIVARSLTKELSVPVIGIGAGVGCSGQVLVLHDMLGLTQGDLPRFVRNFLEGGADIGAAVRNYVSAVKSGQFPDDAVHGF